MIRAPLTAAVACLVSLGGALQSTVPTYRIRQVPSGEVELLAGGFWTARAETNRRVTIPHIFQQNQATGRVANFRKAARREGSYEGRRFNDTDVYKAIEAASYALRQAHDPTLEKQLDELIAVIAAAQEPDGYLFPARTINPKAPAPGVGPERWVHLNGSHELYNAGHLYEAAVAHFEATGKRSLLEVAIKNANLIGSVFRADRRRAVPGHEEIELALVKLAEATKRRDYLDLAKFFLDQRGRPHDIEPYPNGPFAMYNDRAYRQDHLPVVEQERAVGHAVRATYLYAGMTDIAALLSPPGYSAALDRLWRDVVSKRLYITGGIGARSGTESFGDDYELPNRDAYAETCAAIGLELWSHRMFRATGDARYLDLAEQVLYNGALSGVSITGDRFFYQNPLASDGSVERSEYFDVACCPANLARTIAQLPGLVYARDDTTLYVALFVSSEARTRVNEIPVRLTQRTSYPWEGDIELRVEPEQATSFTLAVRLPGWSRGQAVASDLYRFHSPDGPSPTLLVNGETVPATLDRGFVRVTRKWGSGDVVHIHFPMRVQRVLAHPSVEENRGRAAIQRGPIVYALEQVDHDGPVQGRVVPLDAPLAHRFRPDLLGGVEVLTGPNLLAVPYYAWANRGKGEMVVWLRYK
jgi:uncharacterized protein